MTTRAVWWLAGVLVLAAAVPVGAAEFQEVGDEAPAGKNATGEECRIRLGAIVKGRLEYQRFNLYCEGWSVASGEITRFRAAKELTPDRMLTDSVWQKRWAERLTGCGPVEPSQILSGTTAALRECKRQDGGWPVVVAAAAVGKRMYTFETFPTNLRVLERAAEVLEGRRALADAGVVREGGLSPAIRRAEAVVGASGKLVGVQDMGAADTLWRLVKLYLRSGNDPGAEAACRRLLEVYERLLGPEPPGSVTIMLELGILVARQGRVDEAERVYARAEQLMPTRSVTWYDQPLLLVYRSWNAQYRRRYEEAVGLARNALAMHEHEQRGVESYAMAHAWATLASALRGAGKLDDATDAAERGLRIFQKSGSDPQGRAWWAGELSHLLGLVLKEQKRYADAGAKLEEAVRRQTALFGESAVVGLLLVDLGANSRAAGDLPAALGYFRKATEVHLGNRASRGRTQRTLAPAYLDALAAAAEVTPVDRPGLMAEAVTAVQLARGSDTARALQAMATRVAAADPALSAVTRELQDALRRRDGVRATLSREIEKPTDQRDARREEGLKDQLREAEEKTESLEARLQAQFPRYASFSAPRPLAASEVTALLRPSEALLVLLPGNEETWVLLARGNEARLHRVKLGLRDLTRRVRALRESLEPMDGRLRPFDVATAAGLHGALLAPLADTLAGVKHLIAVPSGPLLSLPLGLLVTKSPPAAPAGDYRGVPWLARDMAISVLPSVASLRDLRAVAGRSSARRPFIGFGDPIFAGAPGDTRGVAVAAEHCRQGATMDVDVLRGLARLPETARELADIARSLGAGTDSLVLGTDATESRVRATDLSQYRVLAFATHGLLPSELRCQSEPALALTPPASAGPQDDGLLDASEVAQLKLDAEWVVLSACNTARSDGRLAGESLSGLAQGFFYAGARALLASHWAVASRPTVQLTTGMFGVWAREPAAGKAEALRRSQLALAGEAATSHPFFWAPFVLVGDGAPTPP